MPLADAKPDPAALTFEDALKELEDIVTKLESGQVSLEQSISLYERGEKLKQRCEALLKDAEMRIEKITLSADGAPKGVAPLDVDK
jgi:exodeoxyribonuclease VII small subunit